MLLIRRVVGDSMLPTLLPGHIVIAKKNKKPQIGAIVIAMISDREVIKRVASHSDRGYILLGDNPADSTDSRMYGAVSEQHIFGVVIMKLRFGKLTPAPQPTNRSLLAVPYLLAFLITLAILVQLLTFDKLVPLLNAYNLPGGEVTTKIIVSLIVLAELFSLPFLLRMTLSPLARLCSALLSLMAITLWALLGLWAFAGNGPVDNSGLLSSVVPFGWGVTAVILLVALALTLWSFSILNIAAIYRQAPIHRR